jgi:thioredoxin 1
MPSSNVLDVTDLNFDREIAASPLPALVDFTAAWCAPCRALAPHLDALADRHAGRLRVGKVDVDANHELATRFGVTAMPTLLLLRGGEVIGQLVGAVPRAKLEAFVDRALS